MDQDRYAYLMTDMKLRYAASALAQKDIQWMAKYFSPDKPYKIRDIAQAIQTVASGGR